MVSVQVGGTVSREGETDSLHQKQGKTDYDNIILWKIMDLNRKASCNPGIGLFGSGLLDTVY